MTIRWGTWMFGLHGRGTTTQGRQNEPKWRKHELRMYIIVYPFFGWWMMFLRGWAWIFGLPSSAVSQFLKCAWEDWFDSKQTISLWFTLPPILMHVERNEAMQEATFSNHAWNFWCFNSPSKIGVFAAYPYSLKGSHAMCRQWCLSRLSWW